MIVDYIQNITIKTPILSGSQAITITNSFKFLDTYIRSNMKWDIKSNYLLKKTLQILFFLRQLKKYRAKQCLLVPFYTAIIQSILTVSITFWYGSPSKHTIQKMERVITKPSKITGCNLPSLDSIYTQHIIKRTSQDY